MSEPALVRKSRATSSSGDFEAREYVPGKSTIENVLSPYLKVPRADETVLPGQLPVCCLSPVSALKTVDLPTLGFPAKATVTILSSLIF
jgi:hypothetical protein